MAGQAQQDQGAVPAAAIAEGSALAARLFDALREASLDLPGVTRASYGEGEQAAHDIIAEAARGLGLQVERDAIGTLVMTLKGREEGLPAVAIGSHLDSVPHGGNFDGAAGVVMGLAAAATLRAAGVSPARDLVILGIRAEEMCWFPAHYLGSRAMFGLLPRDAAETLTRVDTGRSLAEHMAEQGLDPSPIREGRALMDPKRLACFLEPHIEQGPVLVEEAIPTAIVTGIRGSRRYPRAQVTGTHAHAGAVPRAYRRDAAMAGVALIAALDARWQAEEQAGADLVCTTGILATDPTHHASTKIPGLLRFSIDIRSLDNDLLDRLDTWLHEEAARIGTERGVTFDLGPGTHAAPAPMDPAIQGALRTAATRTGVPVKAMASGAGHDSATFAWLGVPTGMLFIRNRNGSHNPDEAMEMADFTATLSVLVTGLGELLD